MKGDAEAAVILAKGEAEAKAMKIKAEAYKQYGSAAMIDIVAEKLPQVAESVAKPLSAIDNVTVVGGGENISKMSNAVLDGATNVMSIIKSSTGIDIPDLLKKKLEADAKANEPFLD
jgi:flotillin